MTKCSVEDCKDTVKYKGMCGMHYKRWWRHGNAATTLTPTRGFERIECIVEGCYHPCEYSNGMCSMHYQRFYRYGRTHNLEGRRKGYTITWGGYVVLYIDGESIYEHIYLAEKALEKKLPEGAVVHHMNKDAADNYTPMNLVICPNQAYHLLLHRRMREIEARES